MAPAVGIRAPPGTCSSFGKLVRLAKNVTESRQFVCLVDSRLYDPVNNDTIV